MPPSPHGLYVNSCSDVLCCCNCEQLFARNRLPVNHSFGVLCTWCLGNLSRISNEKFQLPPEDGGWPINIAFIKILNIPLEGTKIFTLEDCFHDTNWADEVTKTEEILTDLGTTYLRYIKTERGGTISSDCLNRLVQTKLVALLSAELVTAEGRLNGIKLTRLLIERLVTELVLNLQNSAHVSSYLWSAVRARGCQFLGPAMQEDVLRLILLALIKGELIARKTLVLYIVQTMSDDYPHVSKTCVGHVVQLLYKASCFNVIKRDGESSLMQLKTEFRDYEKLRREHDAQIVQIALEAGLRISAEQWSSLLYGDSNHRTNMETIIDSLHAPHLLNQAVMELRTLLTQNGDPDNLKDVLSDITEIIQIDTNEAKNDFATLYFLLSLLSKILRAYSRFNKTKICDVKFSRKSDKQNSPIVNGQRMYKTRLCREVLMNKLCPRADRCTYAHTSKELRPPTARNMDGERVVEHNLYMSNEVVFVPTQLSQASLATSADVVDSARLMESSIQPIITMVPVMIQPSPLAEVQLAPSAIKNPAINPPPLFMFPPDKPPKMTPLLFPTQTAMPANNMDPYRSLISKPNTVYIPMAPGPAPVPPMDFANKTQLPPAPLHNGAFGAPAKPVMMFMDSPNGHAMCRVNGDVRKQHGFYDLLAENVDNGSGCYNQDGLRIPSNAWDTYNDDQHLLLRRHEIVTRLAQMRLNPIPRSIEEIDEDSTTHVSYTVASSVLFDEFETSQSNHSIELPPMPAIHSLPLSFPDSVMPPRNPPLTGIARMQRKLSIESNFHTQTCVSSTTKITPSNNAASRLSFSVRTACPTTFFNSASTAPTMVQADCSIMNTKNMLDPPLIISSIQQQNLSPQASYEMVNPVNMVEHVPQIIRPLAFTSDPTTLVSHTLDRILDVKERIYDVNMKGGSGSAVEKAQLNMELNIVARQISSLDKQTKQSCLLKELEAVDKRIEDRNVVV